MGDGVAYANSSLSRISCPKTLKKISHGQLYVGAFKFRDHLSADSSLSRSIDGQQNTRPNSITYHGIYRDGGGGGMAVRGGG